MRCVVFVLFLFDAVVCWYLIWCGVYADTCLRFGCFVLCLVFRFVLCCAPMVCVVCFVVCDFVVVL